MFVLLSEVTELIDVGWVWSWPVGQGLLVDWIRLGEIKLTDDQRMIAYMAERAMMSSIFRRSIFIVRMTDFDVEAQ